MSDPELFHSLFSDLSRLVVAVDAMNAAAVVVVVLADVGIVTVMLFGLCISSKDCLSTHAFHCMHVGESLFETLFIERDKRIFTS